MAAALWNVASAGALAFTSRARIVTDAVVEATSRSSAVSAVEAARLRPSAAVAVGVARIRAESATVVTALAESSLIATPATARVVELWNAKRVRAEATSRNSTALSVKALERWNVPVVVGRAFFMLGFLLVTERTP